MLDLVKQETERIESRFLEPACGTGNFLAPILERKLGVVEQRYGKSQFDFERYAVLAVSSIYGIDIQEDNVQHCRERLSKIFDLTYRRLFKNRTKDACRKSVRFILGRNIIHGNARTLKTVGENPEPIVFSEWSLVNASMFKRRDFVFRKLFPTKKEKDSVLFDTIETPLISDMGQPVFIPEPVKKKHKLAHWERLADAD